MRDGLITHLRQQGIIAVFHFVPLHSSSMGQKFGYSDGQLPVTENRSGRLLRLPLFYELREEERQRVVDQVKAFLVRPGARTVPQREELRV